MTIAGRLATTCALFLFLWTPPAASQQPSPDLLGGRPGEFHFILSAQAAQNRYDFVAMRASAERLKNEISSMPADVATRQRLRDEILAWERFVDSMEQQLTVPAGPTAAQAEIALTAAKGQRMCGVCHAGGPGRAQR